MGQRMQRRGVAKSFDFITTTAIKQFSKRSNRPKKPFFSLLAFASNLVIFPALITGQLSRGKNRKQFGRNHSIPHLWSRITAPDWFKESKFSRAKYQNVSRKGHDGAPTKCSRFGPEMVL